jgi:hypothetical protein
LRSAEIYSIAVVKGRYAKLIVVIFFTVAWITISIMLSRLGTDGTQLDASWWLGLIAMFQQGHLSGRDFQFTYGPLGQGIAWIATLLTTTHSAFDSLAMSYVTVRSFTALILALIMLLAKRVGSRQTAFIYVSALFLNIFLEPPAFRIVLFLLCCVMAHRTATALESRWVSVWAAATGLTCFLAQLATPEAGAFGLVTALSVVTLYTRGQMRPRIRTTVAIVAGFGVANLVLSLFYLLTSPGYESLFAYQLYALETMTGYQNGMGFPWDLDRWRTAGLLVVVLATAIAAYRVYRTSDSAQSSLVVSLAIGSVLGLRNALVRSDLGHITYAFTPIVFTFLIAGPGAMAFRRRYINGIVWGAVYGILLAAWPFAGGAALTELWRAGPVSLPAAWRQARDKTTAPEEVISQALLEQIHEHSDAPLLAFPSDNYIPILVHRPLIAPVLQSYMAGTLPLQEYYIRELERYRRQGMEVLYAVDDVGTWRVDAVPAVTRTPDVFTYLYSNFELDTNRTSQTGVYLLRPRLSARAVRFVSTEFAITRENRNTLNVKFSSPITCGLARVELKMDYPLTRILLKPNPIRFQIQHDGRAIGAWRVRPAAIGRNFTILASTIAPQSFHTVFGSSPVPAGTWDAIRFDVPGRDRLGVNPSMVTIRNVECLNPARYISMDNGDAEGSTMSGEPRPGGEALTGYVRVVPAAETPPAIIGRFSHLSTTTESVRATLSKDTLVDISGSQTIGLALVNAGRRQSTIMLSAENHEKGTIAERTITLEPGHHLVRYAQELIDIDSANQLRLRSTQEFGVVALAMDHGGLRLLRTENVDPASAAFVFPHFAIHGGWSTEVSLLNTSPEYMTGTVQFRSGSNRPMIVTINGKTAGEFPYRLEPGASLKLSGGVMSESPR